jgi:hypothetical protein
MDARQRDAVRTAFRKAYFQRYKRTPPTIVEGFLSNILTGEVRVMTDQPAFSPLQEMLPLLFEATQQVVEGGPHA